MNKKGLLTGVIVFLIIIFSSIFWINSPRFLLGDFSSEKFCADQGYLFQTDMGGRYVEYRDKGYGRVRCFRCYVDECDRMEFNVTKDWRGRLHIVRILNNARGELDT